jgi:hypothetical protein
MVGDNGTSPEGTLSGTPNQYTAYKRRFEDRGDDIDHVVELIADAAHIVDMAGSGYCEALSRAAEVRRDLFGPLERRVERPRPSDRHMRIGS